MVKVTIIGASGYLGSELLRILVNHPGVDDIICTSRTLTGKNVSSIHKNLLGAYDGKFTDLETDKIESDVAFFAAPPGEWFAQVPGLLEKGVKVITLGGKFRISDAKIDKEVYGGYENAELLKERVYGLPEVYRKEIKKARFVTNPGCYATSMILGMLPLGKFDSGIDTAKVAVTAISGTSGSGAEPTQETHHPEMSGNMRPYKTAFHRHTPEVESILKDTAYKDIKLSFTPILADLKRGILASTTLYTSSNKTEKDYIGRYSEYYKSEPFVRITADVPELSSVAGSNYCDLRVEYKPEIKRILVLSTIDNMIKGGAGQAVQNMNLMMNLDEKTGLTMLAGHP